MCAWRVLATLRRVACVGACHNLSPYHTFLLCCRSGYACPSIRKHRDLCNSDNLDTNPSLYIYVHRGSSLTDIVSVDFAKIADGRQRAESKILQVGPCVCACGILSLRRRGAFFIIAYVTCYCPLAPSFLIRVASHDTRAPSRFLAVPKLEFELRRSSRNHTSHTV